MTLIALIAAAEAMLYSASRFKRNQARRQQVLMGNGLDSVRALRLVDECLKRKTAGASRVQVFVASKLAEVCRRVVHTRSFEYVLLHLIRTAVLKRRSKFHNTKRRVTL
jgi:aryl carrier-like protein